MAIIESIIDNDLEQCNHALRTDIELQQAEQRFNELLDLLDNNIKFDVEEVFSQYTSRAIRIAYLIGLKDFCNLYLTLSEDIDKIIEKSKIL